MTGVVQEQRMTYRHSLALETEVHCNGSSVQAMFRCRTQNIGIGGVFLPASELPLEPSVDVELVFHLSSNQAREFRMRAQVVRTTEEGAGLRFPALDRESQRQFRLFLMEAKVAARH